SFVNDFMKHIGLIGTVAELTRLSSGTFNLDEATEIDTISEDKMITMYDALMKNEFPQVLYHQEKDIKQGKTIKIMTNNANELISIVNDKKEVLAIYKRVAQGLYACVRGL